ASTVAFRWRASVASSEWAVQSEETAWFTRVLFQWSDWDPPISLRAPFRGPRVTVMSRLGLAGILGMNSETDRRSGSIPWKGRDTLYRTAGQPRNTPRVPFARALRVSAFAPLSRRRTRM